MFDFFLKTFIRFRHNDDGVTLVEYGVALMLALTVGTVALLALGVSVSGMINAANGMMVPPSP